jgi:hypothetical protein
VAKVIWEGWAENFYPGVVTYRPPISTVLAADLTLPTDPAVEKVHQPSFALIIFGLIEPSLKELVT